MLPLTYNWRSLFARKHSTLLTFVVVTTLVFVLSVLLSFVAGLQKSLATSGWPDNLIVLAPGATAESTSLILPEEVARLSQVRGVNQDALGTPLISREVCVQTSIARRGSGASLANVGVRGVDPIAFLVHREVKIVNGRGLQPGTLEVIVGKAASVRYAGLELGGEIPLGRLGNRMFTVVGVFEADGGALENEIWGVRTVLADAYDRPLVSSAHISVTPGYSVRSAIAEITGPTVNLSARTEVGYYEELLVKTREVVSLAMILVSVMTLGAVFAVANTMFAAVDGRRREVAMLRTLGFGRRSIGVAWRVEAFLICSAAGVVGLLGSVLVSGGRQDCLSDASWTAIAYERRVTPANGAIALCISICVGALGAFAPALRAARISVVSALRRV
jgi:ABC-type antimicrobial peptide transport system permease subunit